MGITMLSMTTLGRQRLTAETSALSSNIAWTKQMAITQHYNYFLNFDLTNEAYSIYKDTNQDGLFNAATDTLVKQQDMTVDIFCFQDFDDHNLTPTRVKFAAFTGKADRDVFIELHHAGGVREISIFSDTGYGRGGRRGSRIRRHHGHCFIATAAYSGQDMAKNKGAKPEEVRILEKFRDTRLSTNALGREVVELYYTVSPPVAEYIEQREWAKRVVRAALKPVVWCARKFVGEK
jgi:hypothetical protein